MKRLINATALLCLMSFFILPAMAQKYAYENFTDSLSKKVGEAEVSIKMDVDYPASSTGDNIAAKAIRNWLQKFIKVDPTDLNLPAYTGDIRDGKALISHYMNAYMTTSTTDPDSIGLGLSYILIAKCAYETSKYVSYRVDLDNYMGGAHGMPYTGFAIFRKSDGHILTWRDILKPGSSTILRRQLARGVMRYLEAPTWAQAKERLFLSAPHNTLSTFPMPASAPGLTARGLKAVYQSYEIGPYAIGSPELTIPRTLFPQLLKPAVAAAMRK